MPKPLDKRERNREHDARPGMKQRYSRSAEADAYRALYKLPLWRHPTRGLKARQLAEQSLCERHLKRCEIVAAARRKDHRRLFHQPVAWM